MFRFIKTKFGELVSDDRVTKCIFLNNQPCITRPKFISINSNEPLYYLFIFGVNR